MSTKNEYDFYAHIPDETNSREIRVEHNPYRPEDREPVRWPYFLVLFIIFACIATMLIGKIYIAYIKF
jgi:hypothetical protein